jgi:oxygen-independent coproporphyrinogen-3 oxidase
VDREHTGDEAEAAVHTARESGFDNISIDLMFALPGQMRENWDACLDRALALPITHISTYALTIEPRTPFHRLHATGKLNLPAEDDEVWMYERAMERIQNAGFEHYEVSNFARPGYRSRHNMVYWCNEEHLGFGPGAVSYLNGGRWMNERSPARYIRKVRNSEDLAIETEQLDPKRALAETLIQGLRLRDGIDPLRIHQRFGRSSLEPLQPAFNSLQSRSLLEQDESRIRLTPQGLLLSNEVAMELLP